MRGRPSSRADEVLTYVKATIRGTGRPPSYGMICEATGIRTRQEVLRIVSRLEQRGKLRRRPRSGKIRCLALA